MWEKNKKRRLLLLFLAVLLIILAALVYKWYDGQKKKSMEYENNVTVGDMPGKDQTARKKELQELVDKSRISFSINATPVMENKENMVNWMIENPANNQKLMRTEVLRKDNGKCIFETKAMRPGTYLKAGALKEKLPIGEYPCTAYFYAYDMKTEEYIGKAGAEVLLTVR